MIYLIFFHWFILFHLVINVSASRDSKLKHRQISTCLACPSESNKFKIQVISTKTWKRLMSLALWATLSDLRGETLCQMAIAESQAWRRSLMNDSYIIIHLTLQSVMNIKLWLNFLGIHWCISQILTTTCTKLPALQSTATASKCFKQALE